MDRSTSYAPTPCRPRVTAWWKDSIAPWANSWPSSALSKTGTPIFPWCSWAVALRSRSPQHARLHFMLGRELRTPAELAFGRPPDSSTIPLGPEYAGRLQDRLESAQAFAREQQQSGGVRQKRNYDGRTQGRHLLAGELVWVYSPQQKKGRFPTLDSQWVGPCRVLERLEEVVYRCSCLPGEGRRSIETD